MTDIKRRWADEELHVRARECASDLANPDKKQLRFNEIVATARAFYPNDVAGGVVELVKSCDAEDDTIYVKGRPMWAELRERYAWMISPRHGE
ncbi:hypothetical protein [Hoeflea sp.]|uniref:hypothetical protein n=1 Tax=Hoeflea sp. TaxID=1940281 RepID=UPI0019BC079B|nr:hypothetical protein [Hoeflea sp.]MBC7282596.1 hypothetical protein [Hoeflea sp.]